MTTPSYVSGPSTQPLLGETIGQNLRRTVERFPDRDALVSVYQGYRATYREFWEESFERLDELLEELQAGGGATHDGSTDTE